MSDPKSSIIDSHCHIVFSSFDEDREKEQRLALEASERKRKGRRSTILTGGTGLTEEAELNQPTLLGY